MRFIAGWLASAVVLHALLLLVASYVTLEWQNPLDWTDWQRLVSLLGSLWLGLLGGVFLATRGEGGRA